MNRFRILVYGLYVVLTGWLSGCSDPPSSRSALDVETLRQTLAVPHFRNPLDARTIERWTQRDLVFERVRFQGRYGDWIPALLVYSKLALARPLPVLLCMPGSPNVKEDLLQPMDLMPRWADEGYFVISIDRPYHGDREGDLGQQLSHKGIVKVWGEYVYDLMRTLDYLESRPEADVERVGMLGLSMGGMEALLMGALDERVDVVVSIAGQLDWQEIFAVGSWKTIFAGLDLRHRLVRLGASAVEAHEAFRQEYPDLDVVDATKIAPLLASKPLLLVVGDRDPYIPATAARNTYIAAQASYREQQTVNRLVFWQVAGASHSFTKPMQQRALAWFDQWL